MAGESFLRLDAVAPIPVRPPSGWLAIFDRDDTLVRDRHPIASPTDVELLPDVGPAIGRLGAAGVGVAIASNQGYIARGLLTADQVDEVNREIVRQLADYDVVVWPVLVCPHHPTAADRKMRACSCRKPAPGMLEAIARIRGVEASRCWYIGDTDRDAGAARGAGMRFIRVGDGQSAVHIVNAVERVVAHMDLIE
jgi:D-glycero-D-manno-heptose 1,7-bisphosphate phosphatase